MTTVASSARIRRIPVCPLLCLFLCWWLAAAARGAESPAVDGLVIATTESSAKPVILLDEQGRPLVEHFYDLTARGLALRERDMVLNCQGGSWRAERIPGIGLRFGRTGQLTFCARLRPSTKAPAGDAVIAWIGDASANRGIAIVQRGADVLCLADADGAAAGAARSTLGRLPSAGGFLAIAVSPDGVVSSFDGRLGTRRDGLDLGAATWRDPVVVLGSDAAGRRPWSGRLDGVSMYDRALSSAEMTVVQRALQARLAARPVVKPLRVLGILQAKSDFQLPESIPYARAYAVHQYQITRVIEGSFGQPTMRVGEWMFLDKQLLTTAAREIGKTYELQVEPLEANPQFANDVVFDTLETDYGAPIFMDVGPVFRAPVDAAASVGAAVTAATAPAAGPVPNRPELLITAAQARQLFGSRRARMIIQFAEGSDDAPGRGRQSPLWLLDFARSPLELQLLSEESHSHGGDAFISPDGTRFAYNVQGKIFVARLEPGAPGMTLVGEGFRQRWWIHPRTRDEYLISTSVAHSHSNDIAGTTWIQKLRTGTCEAEGARKVLLAEYCLSEGRSPDGRFICGTEPGCAVGEFLDPLAVEDAKIRIVWSTQKMCNGSIVQNGALSGLMLYEDAAHDRIIFGGKANGVKPPKPIGLPPPYKHLQWAEGATDPDFITASPSIIEDWTHPIKHDAFIYRLSTGRWTVVTRGARNTHLWVEPPRR